jgi:hypothetical protein
MAMHTVVTPTTAIHRVIYSQGDALVNHVFEAERRVKCWSEGK